MSRQSKSRFLCTLLRSFCTSSRHHASHYDVLGITPKATQRDIKTAYYKLSKIYHPDKSDDEASAKKFRAITEAYKVLGNLQLKKMYDKGLLVGRENTSRMDYNPEPEPTDPTLRFYKSRTTRHVAPVMDGKTTIYDFDTWTRTHYGDMLKKTHYEKDMLKKKIENRQAMEHSAHQEALLYFVCTLGAVFIMLVVNGTTDYDKDSLQKKQSIESLATEENVEVLTSNVNNSASNTHIDT